MAYEEKVKRPELSHHLILEGREHLSVSGVEDVESFDESSVVLFTSKGVLIVRGSDLHIEKLSLENGELSVEGNIETLQYENDARERGTIWSRLFR